MTRDPDLPGESISAVSALGLWATREKELVVAKDCKLDSLSRWL